MTKAVFVLMVLTSIVGVSQVGGRDIFFSHFVECYYPQKVSDSIFIFDKPDGDLVNKLPPLDNEFCWYKFAISDSKDAWLKIENIIVLPGCYENLLNSNFEKYKGNWISVKNMKIDLPDAGYGTINYNFYSKPNNNSKIVFTANEFLEMSLISVYGTWAKLKFEKDGKEYIGWLEKKYQCPYPWTTCPVWD